MRIRAAYGRADVAKLLFMRWNELVTDANVYCLFALYQPFHECCAWLDSNEELGSRRMLIESNSSVTVSPAWRNGPLNQATFQSGKIAGSLGIRAGWITGLGSQPRVWDIHLFFLFRAAGVTCSSLSLVNGVFSIGLSWTPNTLLVYLE